VDCGKSWSKEHLEAAVNHGPHISAISPEVAVCLQQEALEKVAQGEAEIIKWDDIINAPHPNLKISPLAAIPHKSRLHSGLIMNPWNPTTKCKCQDGPTIGPQGHGMNGQSPVVHGDGGRY